MEITGLISSRTGRELHKSLKATAQPLCIPERNDSGSPEVPNTHWDFKLETTLPTHVRTM